MTDPSQLVDELDVRRALKRAVTDAGSALAFSFQCRATEPHVIAVLAGESDPNDHVLKALGFERAVRYRQVRAGSNV